jgi:hypothetical protein
MEGVRRLAEPKKRLCLLCCSYYIIRSFSSKLQAWIVTYDIIASSHAAQTLLIISLKKIINSKTLILLVILCDHTIIHKQNIIELRTGTYVDMLFYHMLVGFNLTLQLAQRARDSNCSFFVGALRLPP